MTFIRLKGWALGFLTLLFSCNVAPQTDPVAKDQLADSLEKESFDDLPLNALKREILKSYINNVKEILPDKRKESAFNQLDYNKIIAYDFEGMEEPYPSVIDDSGEFVPVITSQRCLSQEQADKLLYTLSQNSTYGGATAACFLPHLGLVFYKNNQRVGVINVCLDCNYLISDISIPAMLSHKANQGTPQEYCLYGFSESGKQGIINLCKELGFYYSRLKRNNTNNEDK